jgi:hypothetical protein
MEIRFAIHGLRVGQRVSVVRWADGRVEFR